MDDLAPLWQRVVDDVARRDRNFVGSRRRTSTGEFASVCFFESLTRANKVSGAFFIEKRDEAPIYQ